MRIIMKKESASHRCDHCPSKEDGIFCHLNFSEIADIGHHKIINLI